MLRPVEGNFTQKNGNIYPGEGRFTQEKIGLLRDGSKEGSFTLCPGSFNRIRFNRVRFTQDCLVSLRSKLCYSRVGSLLQR